MTHDLHEREMLLRRQRPWHMPPLTPPADVIEQAKALFAKAQADFRPGVDDWQCIGADWDLNLWDDVTGFHASLYPVEDGCTLTAVGSFRIA